MKHLLLLSFTGTGFLGIGTISNMIYNANVILQEKEGKNNTEGHSEG